MSQLLQIDTEKRVSWPLVVTAYGMGLLVLVGIAVLSMIHDRTFEQLTRDTTAFHGDSFYIGILSNIGLFLWAATAGICLFGAAVSRTDSAKSAQTAFLKWAGLFSLFLLADDAFLMHERLLPNHLFIPEMAVYGVYAAFVCLFVLQFRRLILATHYPLLFVAVGFLAMSLVVERCFAATDMGIFLEDSFKFLGIISWLVYFSDTAARAILVRSTHADSSGPSPAGCATS